MIEITLDIMMDVERLYGTYVPTYFDVENDVFHEMLAVLLLQ